VHVLRAEPGSLVGRLRGQRDPREVAGRAVRARPQHAGAHPDLRAAVPPCERLGAHHDRRGAVSHGGTHQQPQRSRDDPTGQDLLTGHPVAVLRLRVQRAVAAVFHRDVRKVGLGRTGLPCVLHGHGRIDVHEVGLGSGRCLVRGRATAEGGRFRQVDRRADRGQWAGLVRVHELLRADGQRHVCGARFDGHAGHPEGGRRGRARVLDVHDGPAEQSGVTERRLSAHHLLARDEPLGGVAEEHHVDVLRGQRRVGQRVADGFLREAPERPAGDLAERGDRCSSYPDCGHEELPP
jgi:hypothetical protein